MKLLPSNHFLRIEFFLGQLLFGTANFLAEELFRAKIQKKSYFLLAGSYNISFEKFYYFIATLPFHSYTFYLLVQLKFASFLMCIYYCSKSHQRQSLFNLLATQSTTFWWSYFLEPLVFKDIYFLQRTNLFGL